MRSTSMRSTCARPRCMCTLTHRAPHYEKGTFFSRAITRRCPYRCQARTVAARASRESSRESCCLPEAVVVHVVFWEDPPHPRVSALDGFRSQGRMSMQGGLPCFVKGCRFRLGQQHAGHLARPEHLRVAPQAVVP
eukprot:2991720-Alexandrium_andersonii.AAC.1